MADGVGERMSSRLVAHIGTFAVGLTIGVLLTKTPESTKHTIENLPALNVEPLPGWIGNSAGVPLKPLAAYYNMKGFPQNPNVFKNQPYVQPVAIPLKVNGYPVILAYEIPNQKKWTRAMLRDDKKESSRIGP